MITLYNYSKRELSEFSDFVSEESKGNSIKIFADIDDLPKYIKKELFNNYVPFKVFGKYLMGFYGDFEIDENLVFNGFIDYIINGKIRQMDELQVKMDKIQDDIFKLQDSKH